MNEDIGYVRAVVDSYGDARPRLDYADWLSARGDPRGRYLREEMKERGGEAALLEFARDLDPVWVARVSRPPVGVCCDRVRFSDPDEARPTLTPCDLDWFEQRFQLTLPAVYRAFLLNYNGGNPTPGHFRIPGRSYQPGCYETVVNFGSIFTAAEPEEH